MSSLKAKLALRLRGRDETGWPVLACALGLACDMPISLEPVSQLAHKSHRDLLKRQATQWNLRWSVYRLWPAVIVIVFA